MTASTSATSTTTTTQSSPAPRVGKFQSDVYDKPVVLIGTSTVKNELTKLALSFASSVTNGFDSDKDIDIKGKSKTDVVLLDLSTINDNDNDKMAQAKDRIQQFYNQDYLVIYINVQNQNNNNNDDDLEKLLIDNSDYELCIKPDDTDDTPIVDLEDPSLQLSTPWDNMEWQFQRLLARAFLPLATPGSTSSSSTNTAHLTMGSNTFFLSLSFPKITDAEPFLEAMCQDVDAMEFRTDLLDCRNDRFEVMHSLQKLRELCRSHATRAPMLPLLGEVIDDSLPVCYTVRTENQAGTFPDDQVGIGQMFDLLELGLRAGVEVLDVESAWNKERTDGILKLVEDRYASQILGSHHVVGRKVTDEEAVEFYRKCALDGRAHGAKVVLSIEEEKDDHQALHAGEAARKIAQEKGEPMIPHIGLILGDVGKYSRVLNIPYTPVTHESLPFVAAPGQMTASQLMTTRFIMGLVPPMKYGILGHNISYSVSPAMQGAAFAAVGLPHSYVLIDMADVEEFVTSDIWKDEVFGGCSVTIPHKQAIIPHLDQLTDAARAIGAVNTVIVKKPVDGEVGSTRTLIGDNTDWRGIFNPLNRQLGSSSAKNDKIGVALILGGGGTARAAAYAATQLGLEKIYYNRTPSKAQDLADSFGGTVAMNMNGEGADSLGSILEGMNGEARVVISTLPAAAGFELPSWFVDNVKDGDGDRKPIIFDVNYKPFWTNLLHQADGHEFPLVRGSEMLWEQGVGQFELWTGRTAPYKVMKSVVLRNCLPEEEEEEE
jgi:pentafunctional AROM polypeptide